MKIQPATPYKKRNLIFDVGDNTPTTWVLDAEDEYWQKTFMNWHKTSINELILLAKNQILKAETQMKELEQELFSSADKELPDEIQRFAEEYDSYDQYFGDEARYWRSSCEDE